MTTFLATPKDWPQVLLGRREAIAADPFDLDAAVRAGAFEGLKRAVRDLGATGTIATVAASGLRGRGGAGFPTGEKWRAAAAQPATQRYVVANGYGADPAVQTDQALLAADPYGVIEGLLIAAFAIGATEAILAVRNDDPSLVTKLEGAALAAEEAGFAGDDVAGSGHRVTVTVRPVQGAYMLGEETVLLKALEGKRGQPDQRPPYPAERGLFDKPTVVNNVQTLAAVPWIASHGGDAFAAIGSKASPGTMLVQLRGPAGAGIAEVPLGTSLKELQQLWHVRQGRAQGDPRRRPDGRPAPGGPRRHALRVRRAARPGRPHRLRVRRLRRRPHLRRGPRAAPDPVLRRRRLRQDDPVPDRAQAAVRDRRPGRDGPAEGRRPAAPRGSRARRRGLRPVRP
jgi:NADH:ubiquinone oxidoreductase subunit F (NADH-binding)